MSIQFGFDYEISLGASLLFLVLRPRMDLSRRQAKCLNINHPICGVPVAPRGRVGGVLGPEPMAQGQVRRAC